MYISQVTSPEVFNLLQGSFSLSLSEVCTRASTCSRATVGGKSLQYLGRQVGTRERRTIINIPQVLRTLRYICAAVQKIRRLVLLPPPGPSCNVLTRWLCERGMSRAHCYSTQVIGACTACPDDGQCKYCTWVTMRANQLAWIDAFQAGGFPELYYYNKNFLHDMPSQVQHST